MYELVVLRFKTSKGGPNSGILIPFGSSLVNHYKDVLTCCITVKLQDQKDYLLYCSIIRFWLQDLMLCYGILCSLQSVLNSAVRLIPRLPCYSSISTNITDVLVWFPVPSRAQSISLFLVHAYVYVSKYKCMYVCTCMYICMYIYIYIYVCVCVFVCVCVCVNCVCMYVCMYVCVYACMYACGTGELP